jgi:hypothetical protein
MNKGTTIGAILFTIGLIIIIIFSFTPIFTENEDILLTPIRISLILLGIGGIIILTSLIKERIQDDKELKKIKKEDLEP